MVLIATRQFFSYGWRVSDAALLIEPTTGQSNKNNWSAAFTTHRLLYHRCYRWCLGSIFVSFRNLAVQIIPSFHALKVASFRFRTWRLR